MLNKIKTIIKNILENRLLLLVIMCAIASVLIIIFGRIKMPGTEKPGLAAPEVFEVKPESRVNTWNDITPGETSYDKTKDKFGKYVRQTSFKGMPVYIHRDAETGIREHQVGVDGEGKVVFVRIPIPYDKAIPFSSYKERMELGEPDIVKYDKDGFFEKAHIYLDKGVWLNVFDTTQVVYHEIYFEPMSMDKFMKLWGDQLIDTYSIPPDLAY